MGFIIQIFPLVISLITVFLAYRTFERNRTIENQNIYFKYKQERYYAILNKIGNLYIFIDRKFDEFYDLEPGEDDEQREKISDEVFDEIGNFHEKVYADCVLLPKKVIEPILKYLERLQDTDILPLDKSQTIEQTLSIISKTQDSIGLIEDAMREDLQLEKINSEFHIRIAGSLSKNEKRT